MSKLVCVVLLLATTAAVRAEPLWSLSAAEWAQPRHGEWLVGHPALAGALDALQQNPHTILQLRYPGGDEGVLWGEELQAWLVALGVESERIERFPGSESADQIQLVVLTRPNPGTSE